VRRPLPDGDRRLRGAGERPRRLARAGRHERDQLAGRDRAVLVVVVVVVGRADLVASTAP